MIEVNKRLLLKVAAGAVAVAALAGCGKSDPPTAPEPAKKA